FPPVRAVWLRDFARRPVDETQLLLWQDDQLALLDRRLPHGPDGAPLRALLAYLFRLSDQNILDEQKLLAGRAPQADFVFREDGWDEAKALDQLGQALRRELRLPVRLSIPQIDRPHVVVSGHYVPARLPGTG